MKEIIKIIEKDGKKVVNARELHAFLGVGKDFSSWIKERISKYDFVEGQDYCSFTEIGEREIGATVRKEYALSIDMAKELSMVENNERGREARRYFIECEKVARGLVSNVSLVDDRARACVTWVKGVKEILNLNDASALALLKQAGDPLGLPTPDYVKSKGVSHSATELLERNEIKVSAQAFNKLLFANGFIRRETRKGTKSVHKYWVITDKGMQYGEDYLSPQNPKQTQPYWYDYKFLELCRLVGVVV